MGEKKASVHLHGRTTGMGGFSKAQASITSINQAVDLGTRAFRQLEAASRMAYGSVSQFVETGALFENYNVQFQALLGTAEAADTRMRSLFDFATKTPYELDVVVQSAKTLEAFGMYSERTLTAAGDAAAAFGVQLEDAVLAVTGAATGEMERIKRFGITSATLAAHMGHEVSRKTQEDLDEIGRAVIELFEIKAGGGMEALSKTMTGMINNLGDSWTRFKLIVSDAGPFEVVHRVLGSVLKVVNDLFETDRAQALGETIGDVLSEVLWKVAIASADAADSLWKVADFLIRNEETTKTGWDALVGSLNPVKAAIDLLTGEAGGGEGAEGGLGLGRQVRLERGRYLGSRFGPPIPEGLYDEPDKPKTASAAAMSKSIATQGQMGPPRPPGQVRGEGDILAMMMVDEDGSEAREATQRYVESRQMMQEADREAWETSVYGSTMATAAWGSFFASSYSVGQKWRKQQTTTLKDVGVAAVQAMRDSTAAYLEAKGQEAAMEATIEGIKAIASLAMFPPDIRGAALHAAAAVGWAALAGTAAIAAGAISAPSGTDRRSEEEAFRGSDAEREADQAGGTRTIDGFAGATRQEIHVHVHVAHYGPTVYGPGGWEELRDEVIAPAVQEIVDSGGLDLARAG